MHFFSFLAALRISRQKRRAAAVARRRCLRRHSQLHFRARLLKPVRPFLLRRARLKTLPLFSNTHLSAVPKIFAQTIQVFGDLGFVLCSKLNFEKMDFYLVKIRKRVKKRGIFHPSRWIYEGEQKMCPSAWLHPASKSALWCGVQSRRGYNVTRNITL